MRFNNIVKTIPFLSTLFIIFFLIIFNQKENTKLRILLWNTPSLPVTTYIAFSTATGFIISYITTRQLSKKSKPKLHKKLNNEFQNDRIETNEVNDSNKTLSYNNILIERDINDPSPTINANFRVIGKTKRMEDQDVLSNDNVIISNESSSYDNLNYDHNLENNDEYYKNRNIKLEDWNDESYINW